MTIGTNTAAEWLAIYMKVVEFVFAKNFYKLFSLFAAGTHVYIGPWESLMGDVYEKLTPEEMCKYPMTNVHQSTQPVYTAFAGFIYNKDMENQELLNVEIMHMYDSKTVIPRKHALKDFGVFSPHKIDHDCVGDFSDAVGERLDKCEKVDHGSNKSLTLKHTQQIFFIYVAGIVLATLAFLVETWLRKRASSM